MERELELAIAQFTGYKEALNGPDVRSLIQSMRLTASEWAAIRESCLWLGPRLLDEVDEYFAKEKPTNG